MQIVQNQNLYKIAIAAPCMREKKFHWAKLFIREIYFISDYIAIDPTLIVASRRGNALASSSQYMISPISRNSLVKHFELSETSECDISGIREEFYSQQRKTQCGHVFSSRARSHRGLWTLREEVDTKSRWKLSKSFRLPPWHYFRLRFAVIQNPFPKSRT